VQLKHLDGAARLDDLAIQAVNPLTTILGELLNGSSVNC
jgi:hypothetical protein